MGIRTKDTKERNAMMQANTFCYANSHCQTSTTAAATPKLGFSKTDKKMIEIWN